MAKAKKKEAGVKTVTGRVLHDPVKDKLRPIFPLDASVKFTPEIRIYQR